jgi:hypothetical protein
MASSTPLFLAVGAIAGGNEWLHGNTPAAIRVAVATAGVVVIFAGIEALPAGSTFAVGIGILALIGVTLGSVTPGVPSPAAQILNAINGGK